MEEEDPNAFSLNLTSAEYILYSDINREITFYWEGALNGERLLIDLNIPAGSTDIFPDRTYNFADEYNVEGTFSDFSSITTGENFGQTTVYAEGGTVKFTRVGDNYKVDFNVRFEDNRTLKCTYEGPIIED